MVIVVRFTPFNSSPKIGFKFAFTEIFNQSISGFIKFTIMRHDLGFFVFEIALALIGMVIFLYFATGKYMEIRKRLNPNYIALPLKEMPAYIFFKWALEVSLSNYLVNVTFISFLVFTKFSNLEKSRIVVYFGAIYA
jgi:hypothetical protein